MNVCSKSSKPYSERRTIAEYFLRQHAITYKTWKSNSDFYIGFTRTEIKTKVKVV